jgi:ADP-ribosylglycohydrolase
MDDQIKLRIIGLFFGQLVGDALGTRYEFKKKEKVVDKISIDVVDNKLQMLGGGPFNVNAGQYTDDSELALGIWYQILLKNEYNIDDIARQFYLWYASMPFDIGNATRTAFGSGNTRKDMLENAKSNMYSLSNGCLMKISAIGAINFLTTNAYNVTILAKEICELTNPNPVCIDMCKCYVRAIEYALKTGDPSIAYKKACEIAELNITKLLLKESLTRTSPVKLINSEGNITEVDTDGTYQGYVGIAFQNAFYHLLNTKTFNEVMIHTICLGGDTDTNACIAGALFGACVGGTNIPRYWLNTIMTHTSSKTRIEIYPAMDHQHVYQMLKSKLKKL